MTFWENLKCKQIEGAASFSGENVKWVILRILHYTTVESLHFISFMNLNHFFQIISAGCVLVNGSMNAQLEVLINCDTVYEHIQSFVISV